jgi:hypothetical protein
VGGLLVAMPPVARIPHLTVYFEAIVVLRLEMVKLIKMYKEEILN